MTEEPADQQSDHTNQHDDSEDKDTVTQSHNAKPRDRELKNVVSSFLSEPLSIGNALVLIVIIGAIVVLIALAIGSAREGAENGIQSAAYARGLITLIFAGGTMLIAVILVLYVINADSPDSDKRFTRGKEVLTILIGVFGTILGFYFGKTDDQPKVPSTSQNQSESDPSTNTPQADPLVPEQQAPAN